MDSTRRLVEGTPSPSIEHQCQSNKYFGFTSRQLKFILTYGLYNVFRGVYILIVGPFYPPEVREYNMCYLPFETLFFIYTSSCYI